MTDKTMDDILDEVASTENPDNPSETETATEDPKPEVEDPKPEVEDPNSSEDPDPTVETDDDDSGDDTDDESEEGKKPKKTQDSSVIRNLRKQQRESSKQVKEYEAMLDRIAKQQNITKDELVDKIQNEADEKEAKEKNIPPEIQRQMREQKEAIENLRQERQREVFNNKFDKLTEDYPMETEQAREFVTNALDMGIDLGNPNTDFKAVYIALNHDSIIEDVRNKTRQQVLKEIEEQGKRSPGINKKRGQSDGAKKGNLNDALSEILG